MELFKFILNNNVSNPCRAAFNQRESILLGKFIGDLME